MRINNMPSGSTAPSGLLARAFTDHPASVGETYWEHFMAAAGFAMRLSRIAAAAAVHALVPSLCKTTASEEIAHLHRQLQQRHTGN